MLDKDFDYRPMLGSNILPGMDSPIDRALETSINPYGAPPKNDKDYRAYRGYYEGVMDKMRQMQGMQTDEGFIKFSASCEWKDDKLNPIHGRGKMRDDHKGCDFVFGCFHIIHTDPVNPEQVYYVPFNRVSPNGYYLCKTCYRLLERYKLNIWREVCVKCSKCIGEAMTERVNKNPELFIDLRMIK